jgi:hypothetical protein
LVYFQTKNPNLGKIGILGSKINHLATLGGSRRRYDVDDEDDDVVAVTVKISEMLFSNILVITLH